jgi:peptidoglycan/LPS O-acetylase OafA/YrhL
MTATTTFTAPTRQPRPESATTPKKVWRTGMVAGVSASVATLAVAAVAQALDVSLEVGGKAIPLLGFSQLTFVASIIGTILAVVLSRRANRPKHTFVATTIALTVLSIVPDVLADAHTSTRFTLALTHAVAAAIVIPALASRLSD